MGSLPLKLDSLSSVLTVVHAGVAGGAGAQYQGSRQDGDDSFHMILFSALVGCYGVDTPVGHSVEDHDGDEH